MQQRPWYRSVGFWLSLVVTSVGVVGASVYANLSYDVTDAEDYAYFPPFKAGYDGNSNDHLGAEYFNIAEALVDGRGYADPFGTPTGPTAWMPPVLTLFEAGLLLHFDRDKVAVANVVIVCQVFSLWLTAVLVLAAGRKTAPAVPSLLVVPLVALALITRFHTAYQVTHDSWMVLLAFDGVLAFALWGRPSASGLRSLAWGVGGGVATLISPVLALCWCLLTVCEAVRVRRGRPLLVACVACALVVTPWVVRNAVVFGRFIPVKSNLAYELYQAQLLSADGRLSDKVFATHPYATHGVERSECAALGEMAFLDRKRAAFDEAVRGNPSHFAEKVYDRLLAATVDYSPMNEAEMERETLSLLCAVTHPLPVLAGFGLLLLAPFRRLSGACWAGLALLAVYLAPYIVVSYYERYEFPLWGLKILVIVWCLDAVFTLVGRGFRRIFRGRREAVPAAATYSESASPRPPAQVIR